MGHHSRERRKWGWQLGPAVWPRVRLIEAAGSCARSASSGGGGGAPDVNLFFSMMSAGVRAEVGEACCDGYVAAEVICTADDLPVFVTSPPPRSP